MAAYSLLITDYYLLVFKPKDGTLNHVIHNAFYLRIIRIKSAIDK